MSSLSNKDFQKIVAMTPRRVDTFDHPSGNSKQDGSQTPMNMGAIQRLGAKEKKQFATDEVKKEKNRERAAKYKKKFIFN